MYFDRSPYKGTSGIQRIINATQYSLAGFKTTFQQEAAFRQIVAINFILIPLSFCISVKPIEQALMIAVCLLAIIVELFNSAIEAVVDRISLEQHPLSKNAKDMGSAAQFFALAIIFSTWSIILVGHFSTSHSFF
jgi:diacylglycerol kinase (ATP)